MPVVQPTFPLCNTQKFNSIPIEDVIPATAILEQFYILTSY